MIMRFSGSELVALRKPLVYVAEKDAKVTYVGASRTGVGRAFQRDGSLHSRNKALSEATSIVVETYETESEAFRREAELIHALHPEANARCPLCDVKRVSHRVKERTTTINSGNRIKILRAVATHMIQEKVDQFVVSNVISLM